MYGSSYYFFLGYFHSVTWSISPVHDVTIPQAACHSCLTLLQRKNNTT